MTATNPPVERSFLRIGYVARAGDGRVIDTTDPDVAADSELADLEASGPVAVVPGEGHLFDPLEAAIRDADPGTTVQMTVEPADAFGAVDPKATATVDEAAVAPEHREAGETIQLGGRRAVVEAVSDGEITVDFNHPLAGLTLEYEIEVLDRLEDPQRRAAGLAATHGLRDVSIEYEADPESVTVRYSESEPSADRDANRRAYVRDVRRLLGIGSVRVVGTYE